MKKLLAILALAITAAIIYAEQVPLTFESIGYTELLKPQAISYNAEVPAVAAVAAIVAVEDDPETADIDETVIGVEAVEAKDAVPASFTVVSLYRLGYKTPVVDTTINGVHAVIAPNSSPEFTITATVPVSVFAQAYTGDVDQLALILSTIGAIQPDEAMCDVIRAFTFSLLQ